MFGQLACIVSVFLAAALALADEAAPAAPRTFSYRLRMDQVDSVEGARVYHRGQAWRPAIMGNPPWTAVKHLPFRVGPGTVRVYTHRYRVQGDVRQTITLGDQTRSAIIKKTDDRYHTPEMVFELTEPTDRLKVHVEAVDPTQKFRTIWYHLTLTNDPRWVYVKGTRSGNPRNTIQFIKAPAFENLPAGNLVPNSGFEEGVRFWEAQPYRSAVMAKPLLLHENAAQGAFALDVAPIDIRSRDFVIRPGRTYRLSFCVAQDNPAPAQVALEAKDARGNYVTVQSFTAEGEGEPCGAAGWRRHRFLVQSPPEEKMPKGLCRLRLTAEPPEAAADKPVLIDAIQLNEAHFAEPLPYGPHRGLEANFVSPTTQNVCEVGKPSGTRFNLQAGEGVQVRRIAYTVYDYFDDVVQAERQLEAAGPFPRDVALPTDRAGFHRVRTRIDTVRDGRQQTLWKEFLYNVLRPVAARKDRREWSLLGAYYVYRPLGPCSYAEIARAFGFYEFNTLGNQIARWIQNVDKKASTPDKLVYDWSGADAHVEAFREAGIHIACQLHLSSGGYGIPKQAKVAGGEPGTYYEFNGSRAGRMGKKPEDRRFSKAMWLDYVRTFARRYRGKFGKYVIEDEPVFYFSPPEYARFYLDTYKAIKEIDPDVPVFFDMYIAKNTRFMDALDELTDGKAAQYMDGLHGYLDSMHSGKVSAKAAMPMRTWIRDHKVPLVTVTCYSGARRLDTAAPTGRPFYLDDRDYEHPSAQYLLDGVVWGGSNCFYYYYGAHTGKDGGIYIFDQFGRVKPLFHFYAAANYLLGGHHGTESLNDWENLRVGIVDKGRNTGVAVLYSVDGKIYDFTLPAAGVGQVRDALANPVEARRVDGTVRHHVSCKPVYLELTDLKAARQSLKKLQFAEKIKIDVRYGVHPTGVLKAQLRLRCDEPLVAEMAVPDVFDITKTHRVTAQKGKGAHSEWYLDLPILERPDRPLKREVRVQIHTNFGDLLLYQDLATPPVRKPPPADS